MRPEADRFPRLAPGRSREWLSYGVSARAVMGIPRKADREVYRLYSEEEFLADAFTPIDWSVTAVAGVPRERRLRRLAGLAALTGAMGTVGGAIAVASIGSRAPGHRVAGRAEARGAARAVAGVAARAVPRVEAIRRSSAPAGRVRAIRRTPVRRRPAHAHPAGASARVSRTSARSGVRAQPISSPAARSESSGRAGSVPGPESNASTQAPVKPPVHSEFGFER
jgi:hypothetical protein